MEIKEIRIFSTPSLEEKTKGYLPTYLVDVVLDNGDLIKKCIVIEWECHIYPDDSEEITKAIIEKYKWEANAGRLRKFNKDELKEEYCVNFDKPILYLSRSPKRRRPNYTVFLAFIYNEFCRTK